MIKRSGSHGELATVASGEERRPSFFALVTALVAVPAVLVSTPWSAAAQETEGEAPATDPAGPIAELCAPESSTRAVVEGRVRGQSSGLPLGGGEVLITVLPPPGNGPAVQNSTTADGLGRFRFCDLPAGSAARVTARHAGTMAAMKMVDLVAGDTASVTLRITPGRVAYVLGWTREASTGLPLEDAIVRLESEGFTVVTNESGRFVLPRVAEGSYTLSVQHRDRGPWTTDVDIEAGVGLELRLRVPIEEDGSESLEVVTDTHPRYLMRTGFYERMQTTDGYFLTPEQVETRRPGGLVNILRALPNVEAPRCRGGNCRTNTLTFDGCRLSIWVDGTRVRSGGLQRIGPERLLAVEAYRRRAQTPERFRDPGEACGSLILWTRR